ncbi:dedicator of cytokinesis protein 7 [Ciona intestinalis]
MKEEESNDSFLTAYFLKSGGSESRRTIPSQFLESVPSQASLTDSTSLVSPSLNIWTDVVEPLEIEDEIESQVDAVSQESDVIRNLADFPSDDIQVVTQEREYRTLRPPLPKEETELPAHVGCCIKSFTQDFSIIENKYEEFGTGKLLSASKERSPEWINQLPKQIYEGDDEEEEEYKWRTCIRGGEFRGSWASSVVNLKNSQSDELLNNLFDSVPQEEVDAENAKLRVKDRHPSLFSLYQPEVNPSSQNYDDHDFPIETILPAPEPYEHFGYRLLVKCLSLELEIDVEPIFASIALYDTKHKKKISENFYFDLNSESTRKMMKSENSLPAVSTLARSAIFSLTYPSQDVFIVIKLEKILQQGDITECAEPYMKDATDKCRDKAKNNAKWFCERLGKYRMPFAWTAIHLMNIVNSATNLRPTDDQQTPEEPKVSTLENRYKQSLTRQCSLSDMELNMLTSFKPVTLTVSSFFKQEGERLKDEDLFKFLLDLKRPSNILKRLKCIPGRMKIDVSPCPPNFPCAITPDLHRVKPYPDQRVRPTREIQEFPALDVNIPHNTYRNLLFILPQSINFTNRPGHSRNLAVKVQILESEEQCNALPLIYGKSNCPEFSTEAYTAITYHNKNPDFYEEIKIQLPTYLTSRHHLFFSFFHISCQRKQDLNPIESHVGYSWLPLLNNGRLRVGDFNLPVSVDKLPPHYSMTSPESQLPGVKWVDGHKPVFSVSIQAVSTVHMLDQHLESFFWLCDLLESSNLNSHNLKLMDGSRIDDLEQELQRSVIAMATESQLHSLVRFLYIILDKLISMLVHPPVVSGQTVNMGQTCFESISRILFRLHQSREFKADSHQRNILLATYARHIFFIPTPGPSEVDPLSSVHKGHYATMTSRQDKRVRPSVKKATFSISSSNPDLSVPTSPDEPTFDPITSDSFVRHSNTRSSLMETQRPTVEGVGVRSVSHKLFHEELILLFVVSTGNVKERALQNAWFLLELTSKSMTQHLEQLGLFSTPRAQRFPSRYLDDLTRLVKMFCHEINGRFNRDYDFAERLNCNLAFFIKDLLSIMDRGFVFQLIHSHCQMLTEKMRTLLNTPPGSILQLRLTFLRVICSHEHYVTLNLPFALPPTPSSPSPSIGSTMSTYTLATKATTRYDLTDRFTRQHYLAGLLLSDIKLSIDILENGTSGVNKVQLYATTTLRNLLMSHDEDTRINASPKLKHSIAALYLPLLSIAIQALPFAHMFDDRPVSDEGNPGNTVVNPLTRSNTGINLTKQMSPESTQNLLLCFLWLVKNTERQTLRSWWIALPPSQLVSVLDLLFISISCFEYKEKAIIRNEFQRTSINRGTKKKDSKSRLQEAILGESSARREMLMRRRGGPNSEKSATIGTTKEGLRWRKDRTEWKQVKHGEKMKQSAEETILARNFSAETTMITLDTLELIIDIATEYNDGGNNTSQMLSSALRVLLHCFSKHQSVTVLKHTFAIQRSIVAKFPELLFEEETEQCADLTLRLLEKCSSNITTVRMQAAASLYLLMRHNFSMGNTFARVKMQVTMSMSSLVGVSHDFDEDYLRRSLKTILTYAKIDTELEATSFPEQVRDLVFNLHMILSDTVKMKEHQEDPEMLIDLMYRIAKGYQNSPDLRLTWLQNMARQHSERKNQAEAGMCLLHSAALVAEYLSMMDHKHHLPIGCVAFENISVNLLEESAVSDDVVSPHADEVCSEKFFSPPGLIAMLEQAVQTFSLAGLHEVVDMIYNILIPIYNHEKDYKKLSNIHEKLRDCFTKINSQTGFGGWEIGKRMFGTYFRVGFYGRKFGDLNKGEFIYKEPAITKLPEISYRLETFYSQCFGAENVEMMKDSSSVDPDLLDPDKAYIQITYVEPFFHEYEDGNKTTYFERNFNVDKFMYATPFTLDGKAHGEMVEQYKRKTFLQVAHTFPYLKTRINVINKWETVLTPLESACEDVKRKTNDLLRTAKLDPPDVRMLQVNLQGAVLTSVNQGPMHVANVFLSDIPEDSKLWIPYNDLRLSFRQFIHACSLALKKNKSLISNDQKEYQREMERNYNRMNENLKPMVNNQAIVQLMLTASNEQLGLC